MATLLRIATAGSVDDGKSTLIGRLLYDSKAVMDDQWASVERTSKDRGHEYTDLSLVTDGLRAEREQGITIDVAYRYFATPKRKFIIADTPGHIQYTRNMVTGASTAQLVIVLVDARQGPRHRASLLGLLGEAGELRLIDARNPALGHQVDLVDRRRPFDDPQVDLGRGVHRLRDVTGLGQDVAQRHREAAGVGGGDELLRVGTGLVLKPGLVRVLPGDHTGGPPKAA